MSKSRCTKCRNRYRTSDPFVSEQFCKITETGLDQHMMLGTTPGNCPLPKRKKKSRKL